MANPEDLSASSEQAATPAAAGPVDPAGEAPKDATEIDPPGQRASETTRISYLQPFTGEASEHQSEQPAPPRRMLPFAASIALAAALGALAGAAATSALTSDTSTPATLAAINSNRTLQDSVTKLEGELTTLRAGLATAQRSTGTQIGKLTERVDRAEKAQAEPNARLAKVTESIDRLEKRLPAPQQQAAAAPPASSDITGSVARPDAKHDTKPPVAEGWRLLDVYGNRAVVESRNGRVFEVMPGSNLPGLGRVDAIKRDDGRVMVVTKNGIIAASIEPRRRPGPGYFSRFPD